ncbi:Phosphotransferase enzyme family protein [Legionella quinlivanii]|uniref:Phosphotransferase enzyme family protein n=1 Tax=Legionella quinlivanii TaxID=45073 RepID=A0A0W0XKV8_9GAMM|nr:aminoglycoside phosphotransferase family protein [Legionella quinlivanii]KTD45208.1 Phosphotransferase enzyme family protein [Legionella quinlivanii]MCW8450331.1 aminoglycoside phosphotransferase family protein [Legionella quinlivanii]SEG05107.1 Phosphotransferase enzyme family protein [Legionella quinlivanii DSM 21216]STY11492.1 Phosphotransferase enzyme family [Legionella quinlivanii]
MNPNENIAASVVASLVNEKVFSSIRLATGDQHFVYAVKTLDAEYVLRMTKETNRKHFISAIYWQEKLIPLGVPLAKFISSDLDGEYSPFPALLMMRLAGDDLCNVYSGLSNSDKKNLAKEMVAIQNCTKVLPEGSSFGISQSYEDRTDFETWYDFLMQRLHLFKDIISKQNIFDAANVSKAISIAIDMKKDFLAIKATPFLWDASERNVLVHQGKISGIVDVDEVCFGDPLFVLGLTYAALENDGQDTLYTDYWAEALELSQKAKLRLEFYRLFYTIVFMRKHSMTTANNQTIVFHVDRLKNMFNQSLKRLL